MLNDDSDLVWSSDLGDLRKDPDAGSGGARQGSAGQRPGGQRPGGQRKGRGKKGVQAPRARVEPGTRMKVRREVAGRKGKAVTTVTDIPLSEAEVKALGAMLKKKCGVGGTAKNGQIEIQGDHRDKVIALLQAEGHDAVAAGG